VFYLDVVYVCNNFQLLHVSSVSFVFFYMLQVLYLNIFKHRSGVAHRMGS